MSRQKYLALIDAICRKGGIADPKPIHEHGNITVNDVPFTLLHAAFADDDRVIVYCDFGELPQGSRELALQRLLEVNMFLYGGENPSFSVNAETGHVLLMGQFSLADASAESVVRLMSTMTLYVRQWRAHHFLGPNDGARGPAASAAAFLRGARAGAAPAAG